MKSISCLMLTAFLLATGPSLHSQNAKSILSLKMLEGEWIAEGGGEPGQGGGSFNFQFDLDGKVMTRKSTSKYPASGNRLASVHKDLMVIYDADGTDSVKAIYFDNEGHRISYSVNFPSDGKTVQFISNLKPGTTGFRLTYELTGAETMNVIFDISPDGLAEHFRTYVKGVSHRKK